MKKYLFTTAFVLALVYSCTSQSTSKNAVKVNNLGVSKEQLATGAELYSARCGKCHDLPTITDFSAKEWQAIMDRMAPKAKLTDEEKNWVLAYVSSNAKK